MLLTGHPAVGKSTFAPRLAEALDAVCLCKDEIRYRAFDGWQPRHPILDGEPELRVGASVFSEDAVVWSVFFWAVRQASHAALVVAETAMTKPVNREQTAAFLATLDVPVVEVVLKAPLERMLDRFRARAAAPDAHPVRAMHDPDRAHLLLSQPYLQLLDDSRVLLVDTTDPAAVDAKEVAAAVLHLFRSFALPPPS